jgi:hypothetical protein
MLIELMAISAAALFALVLAPMVSKDATVAFSVAVFGGITVWEGVRFLLLRLAAAR